MVNDNRWHRLNTCKAWYRVFKFDDENIKERFTIWQLVSYKTPIVQIHHDNKYGEWSVKLNGYPFKSNTTTQHFYKFLKMVGLPYRGSIKQYIMLLQPITPTLSTYYDSVQGITYDMYYDKSEFERIWR